MTSVSFRALSFQAHSLLSDRVVTLSGHQDLDVWQIGNTLSCVSAIKAALAVAFVSNWEVSNHSQSHSPVLQNCLVIKRAGISVWDLELSNQAGPSHDGDKKMGAQGALSASPAVGMG